MRRLSHFAGYFYPANREELMKLLSNFIKGIDPTPVYGCIVPHAGYIYSGWTAGAVYSKINTPEKIIILSPNHNGFGAPAAIFRKGIWSTPLGDINIDEELSDLILEYSEYLREDPSAHTPEHAIEVQLPFLQFLKKDFKIVPITVADYRLPILRDLGTAIEKAISQVETDVLIIASSDFCHYEPQQSVKEKDLYAIESILDLNEEEFLKRVREKDISICGAGPIAITIMVVKALGAKRGLLVDHKTSGDITRDYSAVVGYAGIIFPKET
ncbi:MAG: AmmeMemoRadiSam system protein B [Dictyoglomaceae bacterium]|nr:AmmeMemoRadiSam system protein B [Dictyoglomaceae bacterium]HPU42710.1 AmmeMemoRadiSam system protein B [Dictyoglomaceae bacterium]